MNRFNRLATSVTLLRGFSSKTPGFRFPSIPFLKQPITFEPTIPDFAKSKILSSSNNEKNLKPRKRNTKKVDSAAEIIVPKVNDEKIQKLNVMSWNIDGLAADRRAERIAAVIKTIKSAKPDILFLQEVVIEVKEPIDKLQSLYKIHYSNPMTRYYTAILVSKMFNVEKHDVIDLENSEMGRALQIVEGKIGEQKVFLLTSHLESLKKSKSKRRAQFRFCMDKCKEIIEANPGCFVFFGGDLNLRDDEVSNVPDGMEDAWVSGGSDTKTKFTWDTQINDNKDGFYGTQTRFDRLYWHGPLKNVSFQLKGTKRITAGCFPSDHWAMSVSFSDA